MTKTQKIEKLRRAAVALTAERGGDCGPPESPEHHVWHCIHIVYTRLTNQVHAGIGPTADWNHLDARYKAGGDDDKEIARELLNRAGL